VEKRRRKEGKKVIFTPSLDRGGKGEITISITTKGGGKKGELQTL